MLSVTSEHMAWSEMNPKRISRVSVTAARNYAILSHSALTSRIWRCKKVERYFEWVLGIEAAGVRLLSYQSVLVGTHHDDLVCKTESILCENMIKSSIPHTASDCLQQASQPNHPPLMVTPPATTSSPPPSPTAHPPHDSHQNKPYATAPSSGKTSTTHAPPTPPPPPPR